MSWRLIATLTSFAVGFVSLGQEILWLRIVSFANGNTPQTFSLVLCLYLLGIALGAWLGKRICSDAPTLPTLAKRGAWVLAGSAAVDLASPSVVIALHDSLFIMPVIAALILTTAASKAALFPIVHHLGSQADAAHRGRSIARVYFFNILGATCSPIVIGFWALDHWTSQQLMYLLALVTMGIAVWLHPARQWAWAFIVLPLAAFTLRAEPHAMLEALAHQGSTGRIVMLIENRYGIIHTVADPLGDLVLGGNIYDGRISIDPITNSNHIDRLLLLAALQPSPRRVLIIGLSGGAWTRVIAEFPGVEQIEVVEINPSYLRLIEHYETVRAVLDDPRVRIHLEDGRRWLRRQEGEPFDLIVMNTTFHWRAYASHLLSEEFFRIVRARLAPQGIFAFNATGSPDALATAGQVFPYAFRWKNTNFVYAGEHDFRRGVAANDAKARLASIIGKLVARGRYAESQIANTVDSILGRTWVDVAAETRFAERPLEIITDQNMLTEFRRGKTAWW